MALRRFFNTHLRYRLWRLANPKQPYEKYYADVIGRKVARDGRHDVIGKHARPIRTATELLDHMQQHGLQPHHRFIDYGCGSLRLGKALIEHLEPKNFLGMDVTQYFLDHGRDYIGTELDREKSPALAVISPESLQQAKSFAPDYIASWHVCSKIPDSEMDRYFASILGLMSPKTQAFIQFPRTDRRTRMNSLNWSMSKADFSAAVKRVAPKLKIEFVDITKRNEMGVTETYARLSH
jgi:hypothetical protein